MDQEEFDRLVHYGIRGMKWGVRKRDQGPVDVSVKVRPGKRVQAKGGSGQPAHPDAIKTAAARQKAKKSSTDALSNEELKQLVDRMNLESNYKRLVEGQSKSLLDEGANMALELGQEPVAKLARAHYGIAGETAANMMFKMVKKARGIKGDNNGGKKKK
jgi:hypothetical protein